MRNVYFKALLWGAFLLAGCAYQPTQNPVLGDVAPAQVLLADIPYFPQEQNQCGPASLATLLVHRGVDTDPARLRELLYIPERGGSLAPELLIQARAFGLLAYPLAPNLVDLLGELAAGNPVLVMQNLGLSWIPRWHFAVAIGYDLNRESIILRSADRPNYEMPFDLFERTWQRADRWALVTTQLGEFPATATPNKIAFAAADLEAVGRPQDASLLYNRMTVQWPGNYLGWLGSGNLSYGQGEYDAASSSYQNGLKRNPEAGDLWNNLAYAQMRQQCIANALEAAQCAVESEPDNQSFLETRAEMEDRAGTTDGEACPTLLVNCRP